MPTTFRPYDPDQLLLLAPSLRDWLPEGHLADHVSDLVEGLDPTAFYARYEGDGRRKSPYEPRMMLKVLIHGYATGGFSSRKLARKLEEDVAFRVLGAGNFPSHRTLCEFRRRHLEDFKALFVAVVRLAREMGVANFGKLSIDGTNLKEATELARFYLDDAHRSAQSRFGYGSDGARAISEGSAQRCFDDLLERAERVGDEGVRRRGSA